MAPGAPGVETAVRGAIGLRDFGDFIGSDATGADPDATMPAIHHGAHGLKVRLKTP
jgi:hypothetical protein